VNFSLFFNLHPKTIKSCWTWKPVWDHKSWQVKTGKNYKVWYFHFAWLFVNVQLDNEW
jgi:hypothetical protein